MNKKKSTIIAAIASVMLLAAPQQAEAQLLKKLGKAKASNCGTGDRTVPTLSFYAVGKK